MKQAKTPWWYSSAKLAFGVFLVIAIYYLSTEHRAHITPNLVWVLLGVCLVLHRFMHDAHGGDHDSGYWNGIGIR